MPAAEVRVLGPVEVVGGDGVVSLAAKQIRLLAALLIADGRACGSDELVEAVWNGRRPTSARNLLQVYVSQLRKELPAEAAILTRPGGYALALDPRFLDAARFERLLAEGTRARQEGNSALALSLIGRALALWRGPAYGELRYDEFARGEAERLEELRMLAVEERLDAGLALGRHAELSPELQRLVGEHPLRERLQAQAMLALYRCGRQQEALDLYSAARARLVDELGLEPGGELRELQRRILQQEPSLDVAPTEEAPATQLPAAPNPLLGRERELAELRERLLRDDVRLLVLTGAGGSGKTRLALEAAHETAASYANGAAFVELAPLRDPALVLSAIVRALAIEEDNRDEPLEHLAAFLRARELLLVVDNAEHLHEATTVLSELLARAPRLTMLVTSRAVLHLSGEHVYPVQPLEEEAALALFHGRARQADARFDPDAADQEAMRRICLRLDGLPLAIELAAARTTSLRPSELLERLDASLPLLTGGPRDLPSRQRTLRATLEWSFGLLSEDQHALAARLGIFVGSFDLDAATTVCDADPALLTSLIEQSLLQRTGGRFQYLETIREYALEQLLESPGADDVRQRHFRYFRELAEAADLSAVRRGGGERLDLAAAARDNLRAALAWSLETASVALGLELATALERFWVAHDPREGMRWFAAFLDHPESANVAPAVRASALRAYGGTHDISGDYEAAERLWLQSLELFEEIGDEHGRAVLLHRLGISAMRRRDLARARELVTESHRTHERTGDRWGEAQTIGTLGAIERDSGNEARAYELIAVSLTMAREAGVRWWESGLLAELAMLDLKAGRIDEAEIKGGQCLMLAEEIGDRAGRVLGVGLCAALAALRGQRGRAEDLWASVAHEDGGAPLGGWRRHREDLEATIRGQLGAAWRQHDPASALPLDDSVALALQRRA
jgi:predicted ATPase/DNA-binding SARP family transcriptional activator